MTFIEVEAEVLNGERVVRVGHWRHFKNLETGEGRWFFTGPVARSVKDLARRMNIFPAQMSAKDLETRRQMLLRQGEEITRKYG